MYTEDKDGYFSVFLESSKSATIPASVTALLMYETANGRTTVTSQINERLSCHEIKFSPSRRFLSCLSSIHHNHRPPATSIVWCSYLRRSTNPHNSGRSILHCCWSTSVEQSTTSSPWLWTIAFWVSPVNENAFVWLRTVAPSDLF